jgi:6-phosphogluconate dehydrogenase
MVLSALGAIFMLYLTVLFVADPERLHVVHHVSEAEDDENYITAVLSGFTATLIYAAIAGGLYYRSYGTKEKTEELMQSIKDYFKPHDRNQTYEQTQNLFEKSEEMNELRRSQRL